MFENVSLIIAGLAGLGIFLSAFVNVLKMLGAVGDGMGDKWFKGLNLIVFIVVAVIYFFEVPVDWSQVDSWLTILASLIGLIIQLASGKVAYEYVLRGTPLVGFSHSLDEGQPKG